MADMRPPPTPHLTRRLSVETPEHVILEFELAGIGSRTAAAIYDAVVVFTLMLLFVIASQLVGGMGFWSRGLQGWAAAVFVMLSFLFIWGYFTRSPLPQPRVAICCASWMSNPFLPTCSDYCSSSSTRRTS